MGTGGSCVQRQGAQGKGVRALPAACRVGLARCGSRLPATKLPCPPPPKPAHRLAFAGPAATSARLLDAPVLRQAWGRGARAATAVGACDRIACAASSAAGAAAARGGQQVAGRARAAPPAYVHARAVPLLPGALGQVGAGAGCIKAVVAAEGCAAEEGCAGGAGGGRWLVPCVGGKEAAASSCRAAAAGQQLQGSSCRAAAAGQQLQGSSRRAAAAGQAQPAAHPRAASGPRAGAAARPACSASGAPGCLSAAPSRPTCRGAPRPRCRAPGAPGAVRQVRGRPGGMQHELVVGAQPGGAGAAAHCFVWASMGTLQGSGLPPHSE
jgi:hypothetical protein